MEALPIYLLTVFIAFLCLAGVMLEHRASQAKRAARKAGTEPTPIRRAGSYGPGGLVDSPISQDHTPVQQYKDYPPRHMSQWKDGAPESPLAAAIWQAHVDTQNLDTKVLTGNAFDIAAAMGRLRESTSTLMVELTREFEETP